MLGQVLAPRRPNAANALAGADQILQGTSFDRVQLAQVHDRFGPIARDGRGRQKVPAEDLTTANLVPDGAGLEDIPGDQLRSLGFLIGEHCEASPAPRRIGQGSGDRVAPIDPIAAAAAPAARPQRARFLRPAERRRPFEAALPGSLLWRAWLSQGFSSGVASGNKIGCSPTRLARARSAGQRRH